jgi:hypothetical protein
MAKLTLSEAARACNVARTTIQRAVKTGRLALDAEHRIDTADLLRVGYQLDAAVLHAASQQATMHTQQNAAPAHSTPVQQGAAPQELQLLRQERDALQREHDLLAQQVNLLRSIQQTTQQQLRQAQQMLHEMQHRYDRLLDMPRSAPPTQAQPPIRTSRPQQSGPSTYDPQPAIARILTLRQQGLSFARIAAQLDAEGIPARHERPWNRSSVRFVFRTYSTEE